MLVLYSSSWYTKKASRSTWLTEANEQGASMANLPITPSFLLLYTCTRDPIGELAQSLHVLIPG